MSFFGRLLGRETDEQRIMRASECIASGEPDLVPKILMGIDADPARVLITRARDMVAAREAKAALPAPARPHFEVDETDPESAEFRRDPYVHRPESVLTLGFAGDGTQTIGIGDDLVALNQPRSDDDGKKRSRDGLDVARRLVKTLADEDRLELPAFPFIEAALLLARAGDKPRRFKSSQRRRLADMCWASVARDHERVIALGAADAKVGAYVVPLVLPFAPGLLAKFAPDDLSVLRVLAAIDPAAAEAAIAKLAINTTPIVIGEATLLAIDAGFDPAPLLARWPKLDEAGDDTAHLWRAFEVRRLARTDLEAAFELERKLPDLWKRDDDASYAIAARLAKADPDRALARAAELGPDLYHVGWLNGCVRGAPDRAGALVDAWIDDFTASTYDPYGFFRAILIACIELGDPARVRRLCQRGGPNGWQIAHAARWNLGRAANRVALLHACLAPYPAGFVAGRAVDQLGFSMAVGKVVIRPQWLQLARPHPVETLSLVAALGPDGPMWDDDVLP
jgi:hypothetical protein